MSDNWGNIFILFNISMNIIHFCIYDWSLFEYDWHFENMTTNCWRVLMMKRSTPTVVFLLSTDIDDLINSVNRWRKSLAVQVVRCSIVFLIVLIHIWVVFNWIDTAGQTKLQIRVRAQTKCHIFDVLVKWS